MKNIRQKITSMRSLILIVTFIIARTCSTTVAGEWVSTMLPLPSDLELLLDSIYDDGYSAEYLVKYDDITGDDLSQSDLLLGWERPSGRRPAENQQGIIDSDRDEVRNFPPWMNYSKAVFVPNEADYKIRARHKIHPHNGRMAGTLQKQMERFQGDENYNVASAHESATQSSAKVKTGETAENLDFLLPIPEFGPKFKPQPTKVNSTKKLFSKTMSQKFDNALSERFVYTPGPDMVVVTPTHTSNNSGSSLLGLVDLFRKKFKPITKENQTPTNRIGSDNTGSLLERLHAKLIKMKDLEERSCYRKNAEEEKQLIQMDESTNNEMQTKRHRAIRPIVTHTRRFHPGHRSSYIAHIGSLTSHQHNKSNKD